MRLASRSTAAVAFAAFALSVFALAAEKPRGLRGPPADGRLRPGRRISPATTGRTAAELKLPRVAPAPKIAR